MTSKTESTGLFLWTFWSLRLQQIKLIWTEMTQPKVNDRFNCQDRQLLVVLIMWVISNTHNVHTGHPFFFFKSLSENVRLPVNYPWIRKKGGGYKICGSLIRENQSQLSSNPGLDKLELGAVSLSHTSLKQQLIQLNYFLIISLFKLIQHQTRCCWGSRSMEWTKQSHRLYFQVLISGHTTLSHIILHLLLILHTLIIHSQYECAWCIHLPVSNINTERKLLYRIQLVWDMHTHIHLVNTCTYT